MTDAEKLAAILKYIAGDAARETNYEMNPEFNPADDGNFNDAYNAGYMDAEVHVSRAILAILEGE